MGNLRIEKKGDANFALFGIIDEFAEFAEIMGEAQSSEEIFFDMKGISRINSTGVRQWVNFLKEMVSTKIIYENCPSIVVDQFNMVPDFLGKNSMVNSFYAIYYCEDCDEEIHKLIESKSLDSNHPELPIHICPNGEEAEFDGFEDEYLQFLTNVKN